MKLIEAARLLFPAHSTAARSYAERNLLSLHGRRERLVTMLRGAKLRGTESESSDLSFLELARRWIGGEDWLLLRDYSGNGRERMLFFVFEGDATEPSRVVKVRRIEAAGPSLGKEARVLDALRGTLDSSMLSCVPRLEEYLVEGTHEVLVISAIRGVPLTILMQRSVRPRLAHTPHVVAAGAWLGAFHSATRYGERTAVHGDFWPRNVLYSRPDDVAGVIDWEHASMSGSPWNDLFTLPMLFVTDPPAWRAGDRRRDLVRAFSGRGALGRAVRSYFAAYARAASVPLPVVRDAFDEWVSSGGAGSLAESGTFAGAFAGDVP